MDAKEVILSLMERDEFKEWTKHKKDFYPVHFFAFFDRNFMKDCHVGFFDNEKGVMDTFALANDRIEINTESDLLKPAHAKIKQLELDRIRIGTEEAFDKLNKLMREKYKKEGIDKIFFILQNIDVGQVWNITTVTKSFNTLNVKIDSESGKIVEDKLMSIFEFRR
jgi:hypothetical protein